MAIKVGFSSVDITPPLGARRIGWLKLIIAEKILDPLTANVAVIESGDNRIALVQLDTLSIRWTQVNDIRSRVESRYGFPGGSVMVCGTHNHAGPAISSAGVVRRDDAYIETTVNKVVDAFGSALESVRDAEMAFGYRAEFDIAFNRRVVMRDGTVKTHGTFNDPDALYLEGPIDPEVAVIAARDAGGKLLGSIINFTCHPTHMGGETVISAGYPGALRREMARRGCPYTIFLNGACGNVHHADPVRGGASKTIEEMGAILADDAFAALGKAAFRKDLKIGSVTTTVQLPYREITEAQINGTAFGAQRFVDPKLYDAMIPPTVERIRERKTQPAEVQALCMDEYALIGIPAEYFVEHGLRIKEESRPAHALVVAHANGMVGYVPTRQAFKRGGYETTFCASSRMAPEAGDIMADAAIGLIRNREQAT
ncbi:MAG TPA: hypothetical protein PL033_15560 [Candidatus Brocadiia bacterium]|nr:hypothetical protein [Candidatus Brocadiia bacterium]